MTVVREIRTPGISIKHDSCRSLQSEQIIHLLMKMENIIFSAIIILTTCNTILSNNLLRGPRQRIPIYREQQIPHEEQLPFDSIFFNSDGPSRENRGLIQELQPMCQEIRTEVPASFYVPNVENADIYYFRPQKIYMVNCSREVTGMETNTGCWPQHCREKYVDVDIFGKPKTVKENLWQLLMEIPSVPIACECFKLT